MHRFFFSTSDGRFISDSESRMQGQSKLHGVLHCSQSKCTPVSMSSTPGPLFSPRGFAAESKSDSSDFLNVFII
eukprot:8231835-Ditylum_brightwellii.AAC.2